MVEMKVAVYLGHGLAPTIARARLIAANDSSYGQREQRLASQASQCPTLASPEWTSL